VDTTRWPTGRDIVSQAHGYAGVKGSRDYRAPDIGARGEAGFGMATPALESREWKGPLIHLELDLVAEARRAIVKRSGGYSRR